MNGPLQDLAAWLLTYALHSTLFLGLAWVVVRSGRLDHAATDIVWKVALVGGLITATAQSAFELQPRGTISLAPRSAAVPATPTDLEFEKDAVQPVELADPSGTPVASTDGSGAALDAAAAQKPPAPWTAILAAFWLGVALLLVLVYTARRLILTGRLGDRRLVIDDRLTRLLDELRRETGVVAPIRLTSSQAISSPVALGIAEICLPAEALLELEPDQQRAMLAHELAHLVRRDPQWLAFASVLERALFFQPLNRLARRGLQISAEYLADEWAARRTGGVPLARALVKVAEWIQASPLGVPVAGFAEERSQLTVRVQRLLDRAAWGTPRSRWGIGMLATLTLVLMTAFAPGVSRLALQAPAADDRPLSFNTTADTGVVEAVIERLKDEDVEVRRAAAHALGRLGNITAIIPLIAALEDEDEEVRRAALNALSNFERGVPAAPIRRLLAHANAEVRGQAVSMLGQMKDRNSIPAITRLVLDPEEEVRHQALHALEELDAPIADELVGRVLDDRSADVRQTGVQLAGERKLISLVPQLIRLLDDVSGEVRSSAAEALTEMRTEASHRALRMALTHRDAQVRRIAVEYLGEEPDK